MLLRLMICLMVLGVGVVGAFDSTIPVVDLNDYYHPEKKQKFVEDVAKALHEIGFFAVINTGVDQDALQAAYRASEEFFSTPLEYKNEIYAPELNGQRGYVPGETAQGFATKDFKELVHIGRAKNLWPQWMDLQSPMTHLMDVLDQYAQILEGVFSLAIGENEDFLPEMSKGGECLLRTLHYPQNPDSGRLWAARHTDIDLFTILPAATEEGLQVFHDGEWISVKVPANAFIVNGGDMLQNLTNGYFKSAIHQVVAKPNVERYSIVYFIHPRDEDSLSPTEKSIALTGGVQHYPEATRVELLACRLRELGVASPSLLEFERNSQIMQRIQILVESGQAALPVQKTYDIWLKSQ
ncbi:MAG: 2-oxoglutarate and iron-dependent oxygenase domain-containing protein [Chlamydiales bacterium]|nr:2-oxoglutarate and iron-dependent oxygenase domain-containing protein [Chlamydiales bacterium]